MVVDSIHKIARRCLKRIRAASPRFSGDYAAGWRMRKKNNGPGKIPTDIIYNATNYQLIHLLEFGHQKANGGRVDANPHVGPAAEEAADELLSAVADAIEKAGS